MTYVLFWILSGLVPALIMYYFDYYNGTDLTLKDALLLSVCTAFGPCILIILLITWIINTNVVERLQKINLTEYILIKGRKE